jgi:hypothetical protein
VYESEERLKKMDGYIQRRWTVAVDISSGWPSTVLYSEMKEKDDKNIWDNHIININEIGSKVNSSQRNNWCKNCVCPN